MYNTILVDHGIYNSIILIIAWLARAKPMPSIW